MRYLILASLLMTSYAMASEKTLFPQVMNLGNQVQLQIFNNTTGRYSCSGPIYMNLSTGRMESQYYIDQIWGNGLSIRYFRPSDMNARINSASHGIFCNRMN